MFIVVWDDEQSLVVPMTWDEECDGAIHSDGNGIVALFESRIEARKAIKISTLNARLRIAQGSAADTDFTETPGFIRIRPAAKKPEAAR